MSTVGHILKFVFAIAFGSFIAMMTLYLLGTAFAKIFGSNTHKPQGVAQVIFLVGSYLLVSFLGTYLACRVNYKQYFLIAIIVGIIIAAAALPAMVKAQYVFALIAFCAASIAVGAYAAARVNNIIHQKRLAQYEQ